MATQPILLGIFNPQVYVISQISAMPQQHVHTADKQIVHPLPVKALENALLSMG